MGMDRDYIQDMNNQRRKDELREELRRKGQLKEPKKEDNKQRTPPWSKYKWPDVNDI